MLYVIKGAAWIFAVGENFDFGGPFEDAKSKF